MTDFIAIMDETLDIDWEAWERISQAILKSTLSSLMLPGHLVYFPPASPAEQCQVSLRDYLRKE